jgi:hypothetical protein
MKLTTQRPSDAEISVCEVLYTGSHVPSWSDDLPYSLVACGVLLCGKRIMAERKNKYLMQYQYLFFTPVICF